MTRKQATKRALRMAFDLPDAKIRLTPCRLYALHLAAIKVVAELTGSTTAAAEQRIGARANRHTRGMLTDRGQPLGQE